MSFRVAPLIEDREFPEWKGIKPSAAKWVAMKLAFCGNDDGSSVRPSVATVASDTQLSERTVQRVLKKMLEVELLIIEHEENAAARLPRIYRINLDKLAELPLTEAAQGREVRRKERERQARKRVAARGDTVSPLEPGRGDTMSGRGDTMSGRGDTMSPDPILDPEKTHNARERDPAQDGGEVTPERSEEQKNTPPPYNTYWREHGEAMQAAVGGPFWHLWCADLIPLDPDKDDELSGDGGSYHVAARSEGLARELPRHALFEKLQSALGRPLAVHYRSLARDYWIRTTGPGEPPAETLTGADRWLAGERLMAGSGRAFWHGATIWPVDDDGETMTIGVDNPMRFHSIKCDHALGRVIGDAMGRAVQFTMTGEAE